MQRVAYEIATPNVIAEYLDGELLIINLVNGVYFRGEAVAAEAWAVITAGLTTAASPDLHAFTDYLLAEGLIRERTTGGSDSQSMALPAGPFRLERFEDLQDMLTMDPIHDVDPTAGWPQAR